MASRKSDRGRMVKAAEGIYRRNGRYVVPIWDPVTKKRPYHYPEEHGFEQSLAGAKALKRELEDRKARRGRGSQETVKSFGSRWMTDYGQKRSEGTRVHNEERVRAFVRDFGDRKLGEVSRREARAWVVGGTAPEEIAETARRWAGAKETPGGVVVPSHRGNRDAVRAMYSDAQRDGIVQENPFANMRLEGAKGRRNITVLTGAELARLKEIAVEEHGPDFGPVYGALIDVAAWTGMRPGELFGLRWSDVDFDRNLIRVSRAYIAKTGTFGLPKSQEPRTVVLTPGAEDALKLLRREGEAVFVTKQGRPFTPRVHHYYWDPVRRAFFRELPEDHHLKVRKAANPRDVLDFYELRHFCATYLLELGLSPADVAVQLGHRDGGALVMSTYGHPSQDAARDRIRKAFDRAA